MPNPPTSNFRAGWLLSQSALPVWDATCTVIVCTSTDTFQSAVVGQFYAGVDTTQVGRTGSSLSIVPRSPDHPHVGGENVNSSHLTQYGYGPSPRGWGERNPHHRRRPVGRTIPTWVGRTRYAYTQATTTTDHPHVGGENAIGALIGVAFGGPSPRGWGEHRQKTDQRGSDRTIPTWVGRTGRSWPTRAVASDHPHVGGENRSVAALSMARRGPSPRGWGEL